jgi:PPOX class probable FMN-dependent enzyme
MAANCFEYAMKFLSNLKDLEALYQPAPALASMVKELDHLIPEYRRLIELSPFVALATAGQEGLDCSPRGDAKGFVRVLDDSAIALPDRRGNNRIDSLRNIIDDPRVALLFLVPGSGTTFRINGRARITDDEALRKSFEMEGKLPRTVIVISIDRCYFQCARAIHRASLWNPDLHVPASQVPTPGSVLERTSNLEIVAETYDAEWPTRAAKSMW